MTECRFDLGKFLAGASSEAEVRNAYVLGIEGLLQSVPMTEAVRSFIANRFRVSLDKCTVAHDFTFSVGCNDAQSIQAGRALIEQHQKLVIHWMAQYVAALVELAAELEIGED